MQSQLMFLFVRLFQFYGVSGLTLTVQTDFFEIGGSGATLECNLDGTAWDINNSPRDWKAPPNIQTVITDGSAQTGYTEDLSDAATAGIFRMTTPPLDWSIENQLFQCGYLFATASLNATRSTLSRNSGGSTKYEESTKKCVFTISEILPSPTKIVTHVPSGSGEIDISSDSKVQETLADNNDQGQTYSYRIEVDGSNMKDGDQVKFQVTAGPFIENGTCNITKSGLGPGAITGIVIAVIAEIIAAVVLAILWRMKLLCFKEPGLRCGDKAGIVIAVLVGVVVLPAVVIVILWKVKKLCFKVPTEEKPTGSTDSGIRSTSPNQVKPSVENSTPMVESSNVTNSKVDATENSKDPILDIENKKRHTGVDPLTERSEGQPEINKNKPLPSIGQ